MNGKQLLEGMGCIQERFIEEAERRPYPGRARWKWTALAACLCILLYAAWGISSQETSESYTQDTVGATVAGLIEHVPEQTEDAVLQGVQYIRSGWTEEDLSGTRLIASQAELAQYHEDCKLTGELGEAFERYDDAYFAAHDLIVLVVEAGSGSIRHEVLAVRPREQEWVIDLRTIVPEVGTADMARWHILLEIPKDAIQKTDTIIVENVK